jgi:glycosyltransferase involved in cell wall biosynthesis
VKEVLNIHNVDLILIGNGPERSNLSKLSKELNISNNVHFIGFSNQPYNWIINSDIYLSASIVEGSPNSIIESVCLGTPVIAADCFHGPKEILDNGKIGLLVPINNIKEMISSIILLIENKLLREKYSELSVGKKSLYSKERISQIYIHEINKLNETI